jgi:hypothetical protein
VCFKDKPGYYTFRFDRTVSTLQSQCSFPDLPPEVLQKVFSLVQSVPWKCKMRLVNKRWNGVLRHEDSFADSTSMDLNVTGLSSSGCGVVVEDEDGRLFPKLSLSLPDFFEKLLPNLKLITSLRLNNTHRGRLLFGITDLLLIL